MEEQNRKFIENSKCIDDFFRYKEKCNFKILYGGDNYAVTENRECLNNKFSWIVIERCYEQFIIRIDYNIREYISIAIENRQPVSSTPFGMINSQGKDTSNMTANEFKDYIKYLYNFITQYVDIFEWK